MPTIVGGWGKPHVGTIRYGSTDVPLLERDWPEVRADGYRKTYSLRPGQHWLEADVSDKQGELYTSIDGDVVPVGAAIARELLAEGATWACFTELWHGLVIMGADLVCVSPNGEAGQLIDQLRRANGGALAGLPDVIAGFADARVAMREAKARKTGDRLQHAQHVMADVARAVLGERLNLAVVEWGERNVG